MLGLTTLSGAPISTSFFNPNVLINVTGNALSIGVGTAIATTNADALSKWFSSKSWNRYSNCYRNSIVNPNWITKIIRYRNCSSFSRCKRIGYWKLIDLIDRKCYSNRNSSCESYRITSNGKHRRGGYYYLERYSTRGEHDLDTNRPLLINYGIIFFNKLKIRISHYR